MKMAKNERQEAMLRLVRAKEISTQEELAKELESAGWQVLLLYALADDGIFAGYPWCCGCWIW